VVPIPSVESEDVLSVSMDSASISAQSGIHFNMMEDFRLYGLNACKPWWVIVCMDVLEAM
jgi:hypothetical protein